jgi:hypothetical protein
MSQVLMPIVRKAEDRGHVQIDWLNSYHTFSFGNYHDPAHMGFRSLRVINDDIVNPASGFGTTDIGIWKLSPMFYLVPSNIKIVWELAR